MRAWQQVRVTQQYSLTVGAKVFCSTQLNQIQCMHIVWNSPNVFYLRSFFGIENREMISFKMLFELNSILQYK